MLKLLKIRVLNPGLLAINSKISSAGMRAGGNLEKGWGP